MLSVVVFLPVVASVVLMALPRVSDGVARWTFVVVTGVDLALVVGMWIAYAPGPGVTDGFAYEQNYRWIPTVNAGYRVGADGFSLPLIALTALLFFACALYSLRQTHRVRTFVFLFLFLETASLGLFSALDLILFFVSLTCPSWGCTSSSPGGVTVSRRRRR